MDTTFKVILEGVVKDVAEAFLDAEGEDKDRVQVRLVNLLELNYPDFVGRYHKIGKIGKVAFVEIDRSRPEKKSENPFI